MTVSLFLIIFGICSTATVMITEAVKRLISDRTPNLIALIVALVTGCGGTAVYYLFNDIPFTAVNIVAMILMGIAVAVGAMVGYDKVVQGIHQIIGKGWNDGG